jgi:hypothetical protein
MLAVARFKFAQLFLKLVVFLGEARENEDRTIVALRVL